MMLKPLRFLLLVCLQAPLLVFSQLSGTFTVGGSLPDYPNFNVAVFDLVTVGVSGPVEFLVRPGTYTEQIRIPAIAGASSANPIVFRSENGDSSTVTLQFQAPTTADNYVVRLDSASYFTFRQLTIKSLPPPNPTTTGIFGNVVVLDSGATFNRIENCELQGIPIVGNAPQNIGVKMEPTTSSNLNHNLVEGNLIRDCVIGVFLTGVNAQNPATQNSILRNRIIDFELSAISANINDSLRIEGNEILGNSQASGVTGIVLNDCEGLKVRSNRISMLLNGGGLRANNCGGSPGNHNEFANNFISVFGTSSFFGASFSFCDFTDIVHNNFLHYGNSSASTVYLERDSSLMFLNNNLVADQAGNCISVWFPSSTDSIDYNNYFTGGSANLGVKTGVLYNDFSAWQAGSGYAINGLNLDPYYISNTDLHIQQIGLNGAGANVGIGTDIDGEPRTVTPDIGADEISPLNLNLFASALDSLPVPVCDSIIAPGLTVYNAGSQSVTAFQVDWAVNGVSQTPFSFSGNLPAGDTVHLNIGTYLMTGGPLQDYDLEIWTSLPNGSADQFPQNDTLKRNDYYRSLAGTYTLGGTSPDFPNWNSTIIPLAEGGVCDSVIFLVRPGVYDEQVSLTEVPGSGLSKSITYRAENGDTSTTKLTYSLATPQSAFTLLLDGADYFRFEDLTITTDFVPVFSSGAAHIIQLDNGASHNIFRRNHLSGLQYVPGSQNFNYILSMGFACDSNRIVRNHVEGGYRGLSLDGFGVGDEILENLIQNTYDWAVWVRNREKVSIRKNVLNDDGFGTFPAGGMSGMNLFTVRDTILVEENRLAGDFQRGLYINNNGVQNARLLIRNNFFAGRENLLVLRNTDKLEYVGNNVNQSIASTLPTTICDFLNVTNSVFASNVIANSANTNSASILIELETSSFTNVRMDHNNYFSNSIVVEDFFTAYNTLSAWQLASGQDANSIAVDPGYFGPEDLHVCAKALIGAGDPASALSTDIDGELRNLPPTIGADELNVVLDLPADTLACGPIQLQVDFPGATYLWSNGTTDSTLTVTMDGVYDVSITDATCGTYRDTIEVTFFSSLNSALGPDTTGCDTILIGKNIPGAAYLWGSGDTTAQLAISTTGTYSVTWTTGCGTASDSIQVTLAPAPANFLGPDTTLCLDTLADLLVSGYQSYLWSDGSTGNSLQNAPPGQVTLSVTDTNNCFGMDTLNLSVSNSYPGPNLGPDTTVCPGNLIVLNAGPGWPNYLWNDSTTSQILITGTTGIYWSETQTADGCVWRDSVLVGAGTPPPINLGPDTALCAGTNLLLDAGSGFAFYSWQNGSGNSTFLVTVPGTYNVTVNQSNGCSAVDTIQVSYFGANFTNLGPDQAECPGTSVTFSPGNFYANYTWSDGSSGNSLTVSQPGTYSVQTVDTNGCPGQDTAFYTLYSPPVVNLGNDTTICNGDTLVLNAGSFNTYSWSPSGPTAPLNPVSTSGAWSVVVTDLNGCAAADTIQLSVQVITGSFTVSSNQTTATFSTQAGTGNPVAWSWDFGDGNTGTGGTTTHTYAAEGTYNVCHTIEDQLGCTFTFCDSVTVMAVGIPAMSAVEVEVFPNPARDRFFLRTPGNLLELSSVILMDLSGRILQPEIRQIDPNQAEVRSDDLAEGMYLLRFRAGERFVTRKIQIIR